MLLSFAPLCLNEFDTDASRADSGQGRGRTRTDSAQGRGRTRVDSAQGHGRTPRTDAPPADSAQRRGRFSRSPFTHH